MSSAEIRLAVVRSGLAAFFEYSIHAALNLPPIVHFLKLLESITVEIQLLAQRGRFWGDSRAVTDSSNLS
jgi:hypothetical protein